MKEEGLFGDNFLNYIYNVVKRKLIRKVLTLYQSRLRGTFLSVNLETFGFCNRKCGFCFNNDKFPKRGVGIMEEWLWKKIIGELSSMRFAGRLSLHFYGEPLLDKRLVDIVKYARERCKYTYIMISTNGDLLNKDFLVKIINSGLDAFMVTDYEEIPQLRLKELEKRYPYWVTLRNKNDFSKNNRAGMIFGTKSKSIQYPCLRPTSQLVINWSGYVLLCCNDYYAKYVYGNVKDQMVLEVWNSRKFKSVRKMLQKSNSRQKFEICKGCDMPPKLIR